jgi:hypothetical protein
MEEDEDIFNENNRQIFVNIGVYFQTNYDDQYAENRDKMCMVLLQLVALHGCRELKSFDSELFCLSSASPSVTSTLFRHYESDIEDEYKYYISDDEIFVDPELE